jgi:hypothetical protein
MDFVTGFIKIINGSSSKNNAEESGTIKLIKDCKISPKTENNETECKPNKQTINKHNIMNLNKFSTLFFEIFLNKKSTKAGNDFILNPYLNLIY